MISWKFNEELSIDMATRWKRLRARFKRPSYCLENGEFLWWNAEFILGDPKVDGINFILSLVYSWTLDETKTKNSGDYGLEIWELLVETNLDHDEIDWFADSYQFTPMLDAHNYFHEQFETRDTNPKSHMPLPEAVQAKVDAIFIVFINKLAARTTKLVVEALLKVSRNN